MAKSSSPESNRGNRQNDAGEIDLRDDSLLVDNDVRGGLQCGLKYVQGSSAQ